MNKLLGFLSFVLVVQGAFGLAHYGFGWFDSAGLIGHIGFLDGYEIFGACILVVLGIGVGGAAERLR